MNREDVADANGFVSLEGIVTARVATTNEDENEKHAAALFKF